jgi:hypothetical protein
VNVGSIRVDRHADEIDPIRPDRRRQPADLSKLGVREPLVETEFAGDGAHFDHDPLLTEAHDQVDLAGSHRHVPVDDDRPASAQNRSGDDFTPATQIQAPFDTLHDALCIGRV